MNQRFVPQPLRFRHPLQVRETGPGFASRLAALNGRRMGEMFHHMGIQPYAMDNGDETAAGVVAALGGLDAEDRDRLIAFTPRTVEGKREYHVAGEVLGTLGINRTFFRFCPHCVLEDVKQIKGPVHARPWLRLEWTIQHYRACHHHDVELVTATPTRRRFQPFDFSETIGELLPTMADLAAGAVPAPPSPFNSWIIARLDGVRDSANWLDAFPLYVAATWCECLGVSALHPPKVPTSKLTQTQWAAAADEGFRIASAGEDSIRDLLRRLTEREKRTRGIIGPRDTYGYGYRLLEKTLKDPAFGPIRDLVRDFARNAMPWKIGTDLLGETVTEHAMATIRTAALESGAAAKTVRKIMERKGIAEKDLEAGLRNHRVLVDKDEIQPLLQKLKGALTTPATAKLLGIDRRQLEAIVEAGGLEDVAGADKVHNAQARFARDDIDAMVVNLLDGAVDVEEPGPRQLGILAARHAAGCTAVEVLRLIFGKRLTWKGRLVGQEGFHSLLLDADEVTAIVRAEAKPFVNLRFCDVPMAIPGLQQKSVEPLAKLRQLDIDEEISPNARRPVPVVTAESAGAFRMKYVTAGELCQTYGLHHAQVKSRLLAAGIELVFDQKKVFAMVYDRTDVEAAAVFGSSCFRTS